MISKNWSERMSRRVLMTNTALVLGGVAAGATATPAAAQQKVSEAAAKYQGQPKGSQSCGVCASFQPPNACKLVEGAISPSGWCQLFTAKS